MEACFWCVKADTRSTCGNERTNLQGRIAARARHIWTGFCWQARCRLSRSDVLAGRVHGWYRSEPRMTEGQNWSARLVLDTQWVCSPWLAWAYLSQTLPKFWGRFLVKTELILKYFLRHLYLVNIILKKQDFSSLKTIPCSLNNTELISLIWQV